MSCCCQSVDAFHIQSLLGQAGLQMTIKYGQDHMKTNLISQLIHRNVVLIAFFSQYDGFMSAYLAKGAGFYKIF